MNPPLVFLTDHPDLQEIPVELHCNSDLLAFLAALPTSAPIQQVRFRPLTFEAELEFENETLAEKLNLSPLTPFEAILTCQYGEVPQLQLLIKADHPTGLIPCRPLLLEGGQNDPPPEVSS